MGFWYWPRSQNPLIAVGYSLEKNKSLRHKKRGVATGRPWIYRGLWIEAGVLRDESKAPNLAAIVT